MRYYGSKRVVRCGCYLQSRTSRLSKVPRRDLGRTLVRHFLKRWEAKTGDFAALLRVSVTHEQASVSIDRNSFASSARRLLAGICGEEPRCGLFGPLAHTDPLGTGPDKRYVCGSRPGRQFIRRRHPWTVSERRSRRICLRRFWTRRTDITRDKMTFAATKRRIC